MAIPLFLNVPISRFRADHNYYSLLYSPLAFTLSLSLSLSGTQEDGRREAVFRAALTSVVGVQITSATTQFRCPGGAGHTGSAASLRWQTQPLEPLYPLPLHTAD